MNNFITIKALLVVTLCSIVVLLSCKDDKIVIPKVSADFSYIINDTTGEVTFTNKSQNAKSYKWDFGNGNTSKEINPKNKYSKDSTYIITLTATNSSGSEIKTDTITILVIQVNVEDFPTDGGSGDGSTDNGSTDDGSIDDEPTDNGSTDNESTANIRQFLDSEKWENAFPNRAGHSYKGQKYDDDFYSFQDLLTAIDELAGKTITVDGQTVNFSSFLNESNPDNNVRELAAFLANVSKETNGGWGSGNNGLGNRLDWGLVFVFEVGHLKENCNLLGYRSPSSQNYPPVDGKCYHGRGPIQLSWNYNYGQFSEFVYGSVDTLLNDPDRISQSGVLAFKSAIWFWMTPQGNKPSCHDIMHDKWMPTKTYTNEKMNMKGFLHTPNIINGGIECRSWSNHHAPYLRANLYLKFLEIFSDFSQAKIDQENQGNKSCYCDDSDGKNQGAMVDY